jgi:hypothetical protein
VVKRQTCMAIAGSVLAALTSFLFAQPALAATGDCGQPISTGSTPLANDCLYTLRAGVELVECELCVCDTDGSSSVSATDAQRCLRVAVGLDVELLCPDCTITTTTTIAETTTTVAEETTTTIPPTTSSTTTTTSTTTTLVPTNPACPGYVEWTTHAGYGAACETNSDCAAGVCDQEGGRCRTETRWDIGWVGFGHDTDLNEGAVERVKVSCEAEEAPCGECEVEGIDPSPGNCRCANDSRAICDEPFEADADDCASCSGGTHNGKPCTSGDDCPGGACSGAAVCQCYASPPIPLSAGGTPTCVVPRFASDLVGTVNVDSGASALPTTMRLVAYIGLATTAPCPACGGTCTGDPGRFCVRDEDCLGAGTCNDDPVANDGNRGGVCATYVGSDSGKPCDKGAFNSTFHAFHSGPAGAWYSLDCMPSAGTNASGLGLLVSSLRSTGSSSLAAELPCTGEGSDLDCPCMLCSNDTTVPCNTHLDCLSVPSKCSLSTSQQNPFLCSSNSDCADVDAGPCNASIDRCSRATSLLCNSNADCLNESVGTCLAPTCSSRGGSGVDPLPNLCESHACSDLGDGTAECTTGPDTKFCSGVVQANGDGIVTCFDDDGCSFGVIGIDAQPCDLVQRQACFLDPIVATGSADPARPVLAETYCMGTLSTSGKNAVLGLPGPVRVERQTSLRSYCDSDPATLYSPGVGGCEP